ncbi:MAG: hypothetical protein CMH57_02660 [Myxococcales bacterium]|nr:hypothetical protein [Myxococcales bacterium]
MRRIALTLALTALVAFTPTMALAHSGGTDSNGCHNNSSTGTRHCHNDGLGGDGGTYLVLGLLGLGALGLIIWGVSSANSSRYSQLEDPPPEPSLHNPWVSEDGAGVMTGFRW